MNDDTKPERELGIGISSILFDTYVGFIDAIVPELNEVLISRLTTKRFVALGGKFPGNTAKGRELLNKVGLGPRNQALDRLDPRSVDEIRRAALGALGAAAMGVPEEETKTKREGAYRPTVQVQEPPTGSPTGLRKRTLQELNSSVGGRDKWITKVAILCEQYRDKILESFEYPCIEVCCVDGKSVALLAAVRFVIKNGTDTHEDNVGSFIDAKSVMNHPCTVVDSGHVLTRSNVYDKRQAKPDVSCWVRAVELKEGMLFEYHYNKWDYQLHRRVEERNAYRYDGVGLVEFPHSEYKALVEAMHSKAS